MTRFIIIRRLVRVLVVGCDTGEYEGSYRFVPGQSVRVHDDDDDTFLLDDGWASFPAGSYRRVTDKDLVISWEKYANIRKVARVLGLKPSQVAGWERFLWKKGVNLKARRQLSS
jgi:hypothetical protein